MSDGNDEYDVPPAPEGGPPPTSEPEPAPEPRRPPAVSVSAGGLTVGDFVFRPTVATETDDTHDSHQNEDRARSREEDERAAQHAGGGGAPAWSSGPRPVVPRSSLDDALDAAREKAREEAARAAGETTELPILLRDPLTGKPIGTG